MGSFDLDLPAETVTRLGDYYSLLTRWNDRLHLVAPCSPEEFATRHVLESLLLLKHLPDGAKVADIGSGAGLPIIPCLLARQDRLAARAMDTGGRMNREDLLQQPFDFGHGSASCGQRT